MDWLREDPYGGANSARFAAHDVTVREVSRVQSFLHLYELLRAYRACAIAPDLRLLQLLPRRTCSVWPLREEQPAVRRGGDPASLGRPRLRGRPARPWRGCVSASRQNGGKSNKASVFIGFPSGPLVGRFEALEKRP